MQQLKVTAFLAAPVVGDFTLPLDGILLYYALADAAGEIAPALAPGQSPDYDPHIVPLQVVRSAADENAWCYACSFAQWPDEHIDGVAHWNKRFDERWSMYLAPRDRKKILVGKGHFKSYHTAMRYRSAASVSWWCIGDKDEIARMLEMADNIGSKRSQGWGRVSRWLIEETDACYPLLAADGVTPMRAIPRTLYFELTHDEMALDAMISPLRGFRPPYWSRDNQGECIAPRTT